MARKQTPPSPDSDPLPKGLTRNPFAMLKAKASEGAVSPAERRLEPSAKIEPRPVEATKKTKPRACSSPSTRAAVIVRRERSGRGGKAVTVVKGPGLAGRDLDGLVREIARGLGTGARVEGATLVVQGSQPERLVAWLAGHGFESVARGN